MHLQNVPAETESDDDIDCERMREDECATSSESEDEAVHIDAALEQGLRRAGLTLPARVGGKVLSDASLQLAVTAFNDLKQKPKGETVNVPQAQGYGTQRRSSVPSDDGVFCFAAVHFHSN